AHVEQFRIERGLPRDLKGGIKSVKVERDAGRIRHALDTREAPQLVGETLSLTRRQPRHASNHDDAVAPDAKIDVTHEVDLPEHHDRSNRQADGDGKL